ncbi:hypothetical protein [Pseudothermotoga thermarum]|uniref:Uncharacterized protein n=1 Tax=Pseudothermotoga thermarum DSM 5069 TaxID=688269 RepID=F7YX02_9THEM|nr:hypothetical protein [Pseudothermotoga thermarum]AEH50595.1 hypothetical protein Theth_0506 [Pseudothermotoga thermarum DSM 5069]
MLSDRKTCKRLLIKLLVTFVLITVFNVSNAQTVYRYDSTTGLWKMVDGEDASLNLVTQPLQGSSSAASTVIPLQGTVAIEPSSVLETKSISLTTKARWYYYMTYTVTDSSQERSYQILAGQNINIGTVMVWNDTARIYIKFELTNGWLANQSHLNFLQNEPDDSYNPVPGQFPFKTNHSPNVTTYTYQIPLAEVQSKCSFSPQQGEPIYILLHLSVKKGNQNETAWAGSEITGCFSVSISATNLAWFLRKPGDYATKAFDVNVISNYPVVITFKDFDNPINAAGVSLRTYFAFDGLGNWITPSDLNSITKTLEPGTSTFSMYHRVILQGQPACIYFSVGTISFAVVMVKSQIIK